MNHLAQSARNGFCTSVLNRKSESRKDKAWIQDQLVNPAALFIPVWRSKNLFSRQELHQPVFLDWSAVEQLITVDMDACVFLGMQSERPCFAIEVPEDEASAPEMFSNLGLFQDIRKVGALIDSQSSGLLAYARGIIHWHQNQRFCGKCGHPTASRESGHMRVCSNKKCALEHFPRTDPAIIVLVTYGEKCLLARQPTWKPKGYATIAGFVEPGESLEQAVVREVLEETDVRVDSVTYHSLQPWPFPCSIMLGFTAVAGNPDIRIDGQEIEDARWFLPAEIYDGVTSGSLFLPPGLSISHSLIADWYDRHGQGRLADIISADSKW